MICTEIFQFRTLGAEKTEFKVSNPLSNKHILETWEWWHLKELELLIQKHPQLVKIAHFSPEKIPHMNPQSMFERPLLSPK